MDNSSSGLNPDSLNPPPDVAASVWPPPPTSRPQGAWFPFKTILSRAEGTVANFRVGHLFLADEGVTIQGKAVTRYEIQVPILIACLFLRLGFLIAYAVMEYGIRRDEAMTIPWPDVRQVVLVPAKRRVCLVYDAPNYKGVTKTFSLAFALAAGQYEDFVALAAAFLPGRVMPGRLRAWTSPPSWVFLGGVLLSIAILVALALTGNLKS